MADWRSENVHTGVNFIEKAESSATVRFVRITYVRRAGDQASTDGDPLLADAAASYHPPAGFSYRTFVPAAVKVGMCSGAPEYESFTATWERSKAWLKYIGTSVFYLTVGPSLCIPSSLFPWSAWPLRLSWTISNSLSSDNTATLLWSLIHTKFESQLSKSITTYL